MNAVLALSAYYAGDLADAYVRAAAAVKDVPPGDTGWSSMAILSVFAQSRWESIKKAVKQKQDFPPEWLTDVHAAYSVLLKHPLGTDAQVLWHYDLLDWLARHRIPAVTVSDVFAHEIAAGGRPYFRIDGHLTPIGHRLVADRLGAVLGDL